MPALTLVLLGLLFYVMVTQKGFKPTFKMLIVILLVSEIIFTYGGIVSVDGSGILHRSVFLQWCVIVYCFYGIIFKKVEINANILRFFFFANIVFVILISINLIFPYNGYIPQSIKSSPWDDYVLGLTHLVKFEANVSSIKVFLKVIGPAFLLLVAKSCFNNNDVYDILEQTINWAKYNCFIGLAQFILANLLGANDIFFKIRSFLIGPVTSSHSFVDAVRGNLIPITGLSEEPSHFVMSMYYFLVLMLIFFVCYNKKCTSNTRNKFKRYAILAILLMFLSGGLSCIWYLFMLVVLFLILKVSIVNYKTKRTIFAKVTIVISITLFVVSIIWQLFASGYDGYYINRLKNVFLLIDYILSGQALFLYNILPLSEIARITSIVYTGNIFFDRPLVGLGITGFCAHDVTISMLANFGLIGTAMWFFLAVYKKAPQVHYDLLFLIVFYFLGGLPIGTYERVISQFYFHFIVLTTALYYKQDSFEI